MRIQLDFDDRGQDLLAEVRTAVGPRTYKDIFSNALSLLRWAIREHGNGRMIGSSDGINFRQLVMPILDCSTASPPRAAAKANTVPDEPQAGTAGVGV